jgi:hypothetical protein
MMVKLVIFKRSSQIGHFKLIVGKRRVSSIEVPHGFVYRLIITYSSRPGGMRRT